MAVTVSVWAVSPVYSTEQVLVKAAGGPVGDQVAGGEVEVAAEVVGGEVDVAGRVGLGTRCRCR